MTLLRSATAIVLLMGATGCGARSEPGDLESPGDAGGVPGAYHDAGLAEASASTDAGSEGDAGDAGDGGLLPWTGGVVMLELDPIGPLVDVAASPASDGVACEYRLGTPFGAFLASCVQPWGPGDPRSQSALSTLYGGISHGDEAYQLDGTGLALQFYATSLAADQVLTDADRPRSGDVLSALDVEALASGTIANDWQDNHVSSGVFDEHGSGMLYLEWANLVQRYLRSHGGPPVTTDLGDPDCIANPVRGQTAHGKICSGIEGILTNAPVETATQTDPLGSGTTVSYPLNALGVNGVPGASTIDADLRRGLQPGAWVADFCYGPPSTPGTPGTACIGGSMLGAMQAAVKRSFGDAAVPAPLDDPGFFFGQWVRALVKYLQGAADPSATLGAIDANGVNEDDLVFDAVAGGSEQAEYVFRGDVAAYAEPPTVLEVTANPATSTIEDLGVRRYDFRGETLLYDTQRTVSTDPVGLEPLFVTNLVGSPVLRSVFPSYACAIDPPSCNGPAPPPGQPASASPYLGYEAAFGSTVFALATLGNPLTPAQLTIDTDGPAGGYPAIQSAMVTVPIFSDPFDLTSAVTGQATELLHHVPASAGAGFSITIDGKRDKFYPTDALGIDGTSFSATLDYEAFFWPDGGSQNAVRALQAPGYQGLVFACAAPSSTYQAPAGAPLLYGDVLSVRMNDSASDILAWTSAHPSAAQSCGLVVYEPSGGVPAAITFLANGVRFDLVAGLEGPVVASVTLFDPNVPTVISQ